MPDEPVTTTVPMQLVITGEVELIKAADVPAWREQQKQKENPS